MHLAALSGGETNDIYAEMAASNLARQYDFLHSVIRAATQTRDLSTSHSLIKALNTHAIAGLHDAAGTYRTVDVTVNGMTFPPPQEEVPSLMDSFVKPESTEGGRRVSVLRRQEGAPVLLG